MTVGVLAILVGQLFDVLTRGIPSTTMTGFGMTLSNQDRWDVINTIEAFSSGC